jgi:hypothetical protein
MASEVSICNRALAMLGANTITSLTDGSTEANVCNAVYADARDAILRAHPWSCAINRASLAQLSTDPVWGFDKAYSLPNDPYCLSVIDLQESQLYRVEGRTLVCNNDTATIKYVARITDPGVFDPTLVFALACRIAAEISYALTQNRALSNDMWNLSEKFINEASSADGAEVGQEEITATIFEGVRA